MLSELSLKLTWIEDAKRSQYNVESNLSFRKNNMTSECAVHLDTHGLSTTYHYRKNAREQREDELDEIGPIVVFMGQFS